MVIVDLDVVRTHESAFKLWTITIGRSERNLDSYWMDLGGLATLLGAVIVHCMSEKIQKNKSRTNFIFVGAEARKLYSRI